MTETRIRWLLTLSLLALAARVAAALAIGAEFKFADEAIYVDTARRLSAGGGYGAEYDRVPAYPVFLLLLSFGAPVGLGLLRVGQAAVAALGAGLVFVLGDRLFGRRAAVVAGLVYALDPLMVVASGLLYPETIAAVLLALTVVVALHAAERDRPWFSVLAGVLLGVLAQLRPVALVLPPVVAGWIALTLPGRGTRRLTHVAALSLAFLLALAPWTARNLRVHGTLVPVATAGSQAFPTTRGEVARRGLAGSLAELAWRDPAAFASHFAEQFLHFWELAPSGMSSDDPARRAAFNRRDPRLPVRPIFSRRLRDLVSAGSFGLELSLAILGLVAVGRQRWSRALLPLAVILAYAAGHALVLATLRYRMTVLPLVFLFTGAGAAALYSAAHSFRARE
jgi:4-amino-4-deoxy-L-arabinose transferase-like glycosyltransferase